MRTTRTKDFKRKKNVFALTIKEESAANFQRQMTQFCTGPFSVIKSFLADQYVHLIYKEQEALNLAIT